MIDLSDVCRNSNFDQGFSVFFIIHLANLRSVKIQGIFQLLMSGNPVRNVLRSVRGFHILSCSYRARTFTSGWHQAVICVETFTIW